MPQVIAAFQHVAPPAGFPDGSGEAGIAHSPSQCRRLAPALGVTTAGQVITEQGERGRLAAGAAQYRGGQDPLCLVRLGRDSQGILQAVGGGVPTPELGQGAHQAPAVLWLSLVAREPIGQQGRAPFGLPRRQSQPCLVALPTILLRWLHASNLARDAEIVGGRRRIVVAGGGPGGQLQIEGPRPAVGSVAARQAFGLGHRTLADRLDLASLEALLQTLEVIDERSRQCRRRPARRHAKQPANGDEGKESKRRHGGSLVQTISAGIPGAAGPDAIPSTARSASATRPLAPPHRRHSAAGRTAREGSRRRHCRRRGSRTPAPHGPPGRGAARGPGRRAAPARSALAAPRLAARCWPVRR